ncbi:MBL fold metallo-hydrolase [bacterium]|nr:MBL fold metallo-hydrolase [bacterium]MCE7908389.1 MBL fold metallo-hydrolase [Candidatus Omnitrophica bacterium COP1]MCK6495018.1 MBL fold metallo-hydrolase [bacterium]NUP92732.1 MBL fold metallo-hydrolase [Candidatus Omnitrophota bacterium]
MKIQFMGAVREVTGSMHILTVGGKRILLDCGFFQGRREESNRMNRNLPFDPSTIDVMVLSHAHIDHSGNIPGLVKKGFKGVIYTTFATRDLCSLMLMDSAYIQVKDAEFFNRKAEERGEKDRITPIYDEADVRACLSRFVAIDYQVTLPILPGVNLTFYNAAHVLGSAVVCLDLEEDGKNLRFLFSGDIGRWGLPILKDPVCPQGVEIFVSESTYGDRLHDPIDSRGESLARVINETTQRKGKVIIPSFALERAQEIVFALKKLFQDKQIPKIPVYVDSPLATSITQVFRMHPECYDEEVLVFTNHQDNPFSFDGLEFITRVEDSKALNERTDPMVIIAASGMCEAGRILHHLRNNISNEHNTILIVGFQAHYTLGRKILRGDSEVRIFGMMHPVEAKIEVLNSFSGHADRNELLRYRTELGDTVRKIFLVHGEDEQAEAYRTLLMENGDKDVTIPELYKEYEII